MAQKDTYAMIAITFSSDCSLFSAPACARKTVAFCLNVSYQHVCPEPVSVKLNARVLSSVQYCTQWIVLKGL